MFSSFKNAKQGSYIDYINQESQLTMNIFDAEWRAFLGILEYKVDLYGRVFGVVDSRNTTQICNSCKFVMGTNNTEKLVLRVREWNCPNYGIHHVKDWNVVSNVLLVG